MSSSRVAPGAGWGESIEARPLGWLLAFAGLSVLLVCAMLLWWWVIGFWPTLFASDQPLGLSFDGRSHLIQCVLLAFVAITSLWIRQGVQQDVRRLGDSAGVPSREIEEAVARNGSPPRTTRRALFAVGAAIGYAMLPLTTQVAFLGLGGWDLHHVWGLASNVAMFFLLLEGAWLASESWRTIHRFMRRHLAVDLLDRREIASIGRIGGRAALVWLGGGTIASSMTWGLERATPIFIVLGVLLVFATLSLVLPAWMARGALVEAKQRELARVREKIKHARDAVLGESGASAGEKASVLQGLLAYEARIESVSEWPYDPSTLIRFAVLVVIATGSWLGGALVERALSAVLD